MQCNAINCPLVFSRYFWKLKLPVGAWHNSSRLVRSVTRFQLKSDLHQTSKSVLHSNMSWQEIWASLPCNLLFQSYSSSHFCPGEWTSRIVHLLNDQHMGVVTAAASLIDALVKKNPDEYKVGRIHNTCCLHLLIYMSAYLPIKCLWYKLNWWHFFSRAVFPLQSQDYPAS